MIDTTTLNQDSVDQELSLEELASYNGGAVPILPALVLGGIGYLVYKGAKRFSKNLKRSIRILTPVAPVTLMDRTKPVILMVSKMKKIPLMGPLLERADISIA